jgi:SAM-dependent methyltransferase
MATAAALPTARGATLSGAGADGTSDATRLAPFNPTSDDAIDVALQLAALREGDTLVDIGCGDGRVLVTAARRHAGVCAVGIEYDPAFATRARARVLAEAEDVQARCVVHCADATRVPLVAGVGAGADSMWASAGVAQAAVLAGAESGAGALTGTGEAAASAAAASGAVSPALLAPLPPERLPAGLSCWPPPPSRLVLFVYLVPGGLVAVTPTLAAALAAGARVVSNMFRVPGLEAYLAHTATTARGMRVYLYARREQGASEPASAPDRSQAAAP